MGSAGGGGVGDIRYRGELRGVPSGTAVKLLLNPPFGQRGCFLAASNTRPPRGRVFAERVSRDVHLCSKTAPGEAMKRYGLTAALVSALLVGGVAAAGPAAAAPAGVRVDLRVLVVTDGGPSTG